MKGFEKRETLRCIRPDGEQGVFVRGNDHVASGRTNNLSNHLPFYIGSVHDFDHAQGTVWRKMQDSGFTVRS